jgi:hypothetical protein
MVERGLQVDPHAAVAGILSDRSDADGCDVEPDPVVDGHRPQRAEHLGQDLRVVGAESEQVRIAGRAMGLAVPQLEEQSAFQDELARMSRGREAIQQPLDAVARDA